jgi:hypothetical protein
MDSDDALVLFAIALYDCDEDEPYRIPQPGVWRVVANQFELAGCSCDCGNESDRVDADLAPEGFGCCL